MSVGESQAQPATRALLAAGVLLSKVDFLSANGDSHHLGKTLLTTSLAALDDTMKIPR